jgi:hypothetical protein
MKSISLVSLSLATVFAIQFQALAQETRNGRHLPDSPGLTKSIRAGIFNAELLEKPEAYQSGETRNQFEQWCDQTKQYLSDISTQGGRDYVQERHDKVFADITAAFRAISKNFKNSDTIGAPVSKRYIDHSLSVLDFLKRKSTMPNKDKNLASAALLMSENILETLIHFDQNWYVTKTIHSCGRCGGSRTVTQFDWRAYESALIDLNAKQISWIGEKFAVEDGRGGRYPFGSVQKFLAVAEGISYNAAFELQRNEYAYEYARQYNDLIILSEDLRNLRTAGSGPYAGMSAQEITTYVSNRLDIVSGGMFYNRR